MRARTLGITAVLSMSLAFVSDVGLANAAPEPGNTWFVRAATMPGGNGTATSPFGSLDQVGAASRANDTIVVLGSPVGVPPLNGGIELKPGQKLVGRSGPGVVAAVSNTTLAHDGDVVRLARDNEVRDLTIVDAFRGGVYGKDVGKVVIAGNNVSRTNILCNEGFIVQPFAVPLGVPFGVPLPPTPNIVALNNGWAAVMIDGGRDSADVAISDNSVHDTSCGDGIDIRTYNSGRITAALTYNRLDNINLGFVKLSVLAIGLQSVGESELTASLTGNTLTNIATVASGLLNATADSEGIFINAAGRAKMRVSVDRNTYRTGGGHLSANGLEFVTSNGTSDSEVKVTNSSFVDVPGDIIQSVNLSAEGARHALVVDSVTAGGSSFPAAPLNPYIPGNLGTCMFAGSFSGDNRTSLDIRNSHFSRCSADGIGIFSYAPSGTGARGAGQMAFAISDTTVSDVALSDLNIMNVGNIGSFTGKVEKSQFPGGGRSSIRVTNQNGLLGPGSVLDFGGGRLGSVGQNCVDSATAAAMAASPIPVEHNGPWAVCATR